MGPLPLNIGKINRLAPAHVLAVCVVQCTSCTECELVQVVHVHNGRCTNIY